MRLPAVRLLRFVGDLKKARPREQVDFVASDLERWFARPVACPRGTGVGRL